MKGHPYEQGFDLRLVPEKLGEPFRWRTPKMIFVNSMSDLFHEGIPDSYIEAVARVMVKANWHTYQVLTKRSKRLTKLLSTRLQFAASARHIWWGVSVEDKRYGLARIPDLQSAPATVRFLSIEPLLEDLGRLQLRGIHWVIVGGESGRSARPLKREWVVSIRDQCLAADVPFFFKQWGGFHKKRAGRKLDGKTYNDFPQRLQNPVHVGKDSIQWAAEIERRYAASTADVLIAAFAAD